MNPSFDMIFGNAPFKAGGRQNEALRNAVVVALLFDSFGIGSVCSRTNTATRITECLNVVGVAIPSDFARQLAGVMLTTPSGDGFSHWDIKERAMKPLGIQRQGTSPFLLVWPDAMRVSVLSGIQRRPDYWFDYYDISGHVGVFDHISDVLGGKEKRT
jgi:hypothetical protein